MGIQKPDWFKVDPAKFFADKVVQSMSTLEVGCCLRLLGRQWLDGHITDDIEVLARLCMITPASMRKVWVILSLFFIEIEPGKRANRFMWIEREKVVTDLEKKSDAGAKAAHNRWNAEREKRNGSPMPTAMQDKNRLDKSREEQIRTEDPETEIHQATSFIFLEVGLAGNEARMLVHDAVKAFVHSNKSSPQEAAETLVSLWNQYEKTEIEFKKGVFKFFKEGLWKNPDGWKSKLSEKEAFLQKHAKKAAV